MLMSVLLHGQYRMRGEGLHSVASVVCIPLKEMYGVESANHRIRKMLNFTESAKMG